MSKQIWQHPFKSIIDREWDRTKRILSPLLDNRKKPDILWNKRFGKERSNMEHIVGMCISGKTIYATIEMSKIHTKKFGIELFVRVFRHEILHMIEYKHGAEFKKLCKLVGTEPMVNTKYYIKTSTTWSGTSSSYN